MKIKTTFEPKPVPTAEFDWCATFDGYEAGAPIAYGPTESEAVALLLECLADEGDR
ncbi:MAG: hypothetical protein ACR2K1_04365 [Saprospiraceae bacterium]